jgi:Zn-dependent protease
MPDSCPACGVYLAAAALKCSSCGALVHAAQLEQIAAQAQAAAASGELPAARELWRQALPLLPPDTVQYRSVLAKIAQLEAQAGSAKQPGQSSGQGIWSKAAGALGPIGLLLWKLKALLLGLTKMGTLLSMFASLGVYWALYGWRFAAGLVISIYIHEMGHVQACRNYGIPASAPMFIPGFGAFISLRSMVITPIQDARIGLAGPLYGLGAAVASLGVFAFTQQNIWGAIAHFGAVVNLFNLVPVWQLDGARGFHSLTQRQRVTVLVTVIALWAATSEPMLFLIALGCGYRMFTKDAAQEPDATGLYQFLGLLAALTAVSVLASRQMGAP